MVNFLLTKTCSRGCPYCFATDENEQFQETHMSQSHFKKALKWLEGQPVSQASLMGGEPTRHPEIESISREAKKSSLSFRLFTNALLDKSSIEIDTLIESFNIFIFNLGPEDSYSKKSRYRRTRNNIEEISRNSQKSSMSLNVYKPGFEAYLPILELAQEHDMTVRIDIPNPDGTKDNEFVRPWENEKILKTVVDLIHEMFERNIKLGFDCGLPSSLPCLIKQGILDPGELKELLKNPLLHSSSVQGCPENGILDIHPDLSVSFCLARPDIRVENILEFERIEDIQEKFSAETEKLRDKRPEPCSDCEFFQSEKDGFICKGGCLGLR